MAFCRKIYMVQSHVGEKKPTLSPSPPHPPPPISAGWKFPASSAGLRTDRTSRKPSPSFQPNGSVPQDGHTWGRKDRRGLRVRTPAQWSKMEASSGLRQKDQGSNQAFISYQLCDPGQRSSSLSASISPSIKGD